MNSVHLVTGIHNVHITRSVTLSAVPSLLLRRVSNYLHPVVLADLFCDLIDSLSGPVVKFIFRSVARKDATQDAVDCPCLSCRENTASCDSNSHEFRSPTTSRRTR